MSNASLHVCISMTPENSYRILYLENLNRNEDVGLNKLLERKICSNISNIREVTKVSFCFPENCQQCNNQVPSY